jgi:protoheme IX farnesyltransferase
MLRRKDIAGIKAATESLLYALALTGVTVLPVWLGMAHWIYAPMALACDVWLLTCALLFLSRRSRGSARRLFLASILYLPLVMAALMVCRR